MVLTVNADTNVNVRMEREAGGLNAECQAMSRMKSFQFQSQGF